MIPASQFLQRRLPITILVLPGFSSEKPSCSVSSASRRRIPALSDAQLREILDNLDDSDLELSDEDQLEPSAEDASVNVGGDDEGRE